MIVDLRELEPGTVLQADLCIVGAGAAGIALARDLAGKGHRIVLLEGGGSAYDPRYQALYQGEEHGTLWPEGSSYLASSRLRYLGGTTNHWNGWCRPLDPIDFEARDWVPDSGWPFTAAELRPYYDRAVRYVGISPFDYEPASWELPDRRFLFPPGSAFATSFFHLSGPTRFRRAYYNGLRHPPRLRLLMHANAVRLIANESGTRVAGVEVARLDGERCRVEAKHTVLAAGAIESARLLLASNDVAASGLGNDHDLVGRYFAEHPILPLGQLAVLGPPGSRITYTEFRPGGRGRHDVVGVLSPAAAEQRRLRTHNALVVVQPTRAFEVPELGREVAALAGESATGAEVAEAPWFANLSIVVEPEPDPESRLRLGAERDSLGMPRPVLESRLGEGAARTVVETAALLARQAAASRTARLRTTFDPESPWATARISYHQMGTTRMHSDPRRGVVDADCRVHGIDNLYVAGAGVFPTVGVSNPTLTLLALTLRLADHLRPRIRR